MAHVGTKPGVDGVLRVMVTVVADLVDVSDGELWARRQEDLFGRLDLDRRAAEALLRAVRRQHGVRVAVDVARVRTLVDLLSVVADACGTTLESTSLWTDGPV